MGEKGRTFGEDRVLAMYDIKGKQEFIYRNNHIKEIVGGSCIIRDVFKDYLYGDKEDNELKIYRYNDSQEFAEPKDVEKFSVEEFEKRMESGEYVGEVIFEGGGNFYVLYKDEAAFVEINKKFTKKVLKNTYSLRVNCSCIKGLNAEKFEQDEKRLKEEHWKMEAQQGIIHPVNSLPIVQIDYLTSRPLTKMYQTVRCREMKKEKISQESLAKYEKYWEESKNPEEQLDEKILDELVTQKGEESLLSVIYIDGNQMGDKLNKYLKGQGTYEERINKLRQFSAEVQRDYVTNRIKNINKKLGKRRVVIRAGDEINIICNARDTMKVIDAYYDGFPANCSSCVGVAVFHSHMPFSEAYRIAEECCESAKKKMRENVAKKNFDDVDFMDFHYCQGAIGVSLEEIRAKEMDVPKLEENTCSRPWLIQRKCTYMKKMAEEIAQLLHKIGKSNANKLFSYAKGSQARFLIELERIKTHQKENIDFSLGGQLTTEQIQKLVYDTALVYDLWFEEEGETKDGKNAEQD